MLVPFYNLGSGYYASSPPKLEMLVPTHHPGSHGDSGELQSWKLGAHPPSSLSLLPFPSLPNRAAEKVRTRLEREAGRSPPKVGDVDAHTLPRF